MSDAAEPSHWSAIHLRRVMESLCGVDGEQASGVPAARPVARARTRLARSATYCQLSLRAASFENATERGRLSRPLVCCLLLAYFFFVAGFFTSAFFAVAFFAVSFFVVAVAMVVIPPDCSTTLQLTQCIDISKNSVKKKIDRRLFLFVT